MARLNWIPQNKVIFVNHVQCAYQTKFKREEFFALSPKGKQTPINLLPYKERLGFFMIECSSSHSSVSENVNKSLLIITLWNHRPNPFFHQENPAQYYFSKDVNSFKIFFLFFFFT